MHQNALLPPVLSETQKINIPDENIEFLLSKLCEQADYVDLEFSAICSKLNLGIEIHKMKTTEMEDCLGKLAYICIEL